MKNFIIIYFLGMTTCVFAKNDINQTEETFKNFEINRFVNDVVNHGASIALKIIHNDRNTTDTFNETWEKAFDLFKEGGELEVEYDKVPKDTLIGRDKKNVREDINEILDKVINVLTDGKYVSFREQSRELKENIKELKSDILEYREKQVSAPYESMLSTTKDGYKKKIQEATEKIELYKNEQEQLKEKLKQYLITNGLQLNPEQIDVLLSSADGDDLIKMTLVLKVLNRITDQLMKILQDSSEELSLAKKYYAMHLLSFDLVVHIYQKYIDKVDKVYFVKLNHILEDTKKTLHETQQLLQKEKDETRKSIYKKNIEAQELTLQAARVYSHYLENNKNKIIKAQNIAKKNLALAKNTYTTVTLSMQLQSIMTDNKKIFEKLIKIQMPNIIPFENTQLKLKYQELTARLLNDE